MSVFGGDSWGREAQQRKRRVDDLMSDQLTNDDSHKKLCNGKYACLVCPNNPLFDSSLMLSMHNKGSRHIAAESRLKEWELMRQEEIKKRIALSDGSVDNVGSGTSLQNFHLKGKQIIVGNASSCKSKRQINLKGKPLIERTLKATAEALSCQKPERQVVDEHHIVKKKSAPFFSPYSSSTAKQIAQIPKTMDAGPCLNEQSRGWTNEASVKMLAEHQLELVERRERELKFTAAGWRRDGNGRWFRDENVEFDSDEEDPNICLS